MNTPTPSLMSTGGEATIVRASASTPPDQLAGSLHRFLQDGRQVVIHAIGHGAVGQAAKALPILNTRVINSGVIYLVLFSLIDVMENSKKLTVTRFRLIPHKIGG